jgi:hypothetical protein
MDMAALRRARQGWAMRPIALLDRPVWSPMRRIAMFAMRGYLLLAMVLLLVKSVQLATGHG